jgi:hypothetical protein
VNQVTSEPFFCLAEHTPHCDLAEQSELLAQKLAQGS